MRERERLTLLGPSGSGKTTLLLLIAGHLRADGGSVRYAGRDLAAFSKAQTLAHSASRPVALLLCRDLMWEEAQA